MDEKIAALRALLEVAETSGYHVTEIDDGGEDLEEVDGIDEAVKMASDVEACQLITRLDALGQDEEITWLVIWDCAPDEIIADYTYTPDAQAIWNEWQRRLEDENV